MLAQLPSQLRCSRNPLCLHYLLHHHPHLHVLEVACSRVSCQAGGHTHPAAAPRTTCRRRANHGHSQLLLQRSQGPVSVH